MNSYLKDMMVSAQEQPTVYVDFAIEEYAIYSRKSLGELFKGIDEAIAENVIVGKNLWTEELVSVPKQLRNCRITRKFAPVEIDISWANTEHTTSIIRNLRGEANAID